MKLSILISALLTCSLTANEWKLVWSDEFTVEDQPDPKKWSYESGFVRNKEKQFHTTKRLKNAHFHRDGKHASDHRKREGLSKILTKILLLHHRVPSA